MQSNFLKVMLLLCVALVAIAVGYKFLKIDIELPSEQIEAGNVGSIVTTQTLDSSEDLQSSFQKDVRPKLQPPPSRGDIKARIVENLTTKGAEVLDSRVFDKKSDCDSAVKTVIAEYRKRGVHERDTAETAPFDGSTGSVWMLRNGKNIYYVGCITPEHIDWAVYVHFVPGVNVPTQP